MDEYLDQRMQMWRTSDDEQEYFIRVTNFKKTEPASDDMIEFRQSYSGEERFA